ncbi:MAG TPA: glycosyltransferase [Hanamia sp.]
MSEYPRVLIIYPSCINKEDQHGVSMREWFADWPQNKLAQIYSGNEIGDKKFCAYNFKLGEKERKFGKLFFKFKDSSLGKSSYITILDDEIKNLNKVSLLSLFKNKISGWLIGTGLWELMFPPVLSQEMARFVSDFNPQIIYCQGYSLTFTWIPIMLHDRFNIPICFQTGDDWPSFIYKSSPLSIVMRPMVNKAVRSLLSKSSVRLANGRIMEEEYKKRYGLPFATLMICDNIDRFRNETPRRVVDNGFISVVYSGNLGNYRWASIIELCEAAKQISLDRVKIMVTAFATIIPPEAVNQLQEIDNLQVLPNPSHEELPSYLKGADILFLPESFEEKRANEIHLSISTKAHLYMLSEKPVLVYASSLTGIANYAKEEGWACVVEEQNVSKLAAALKNLIENREYSNKLINKGIEVYLRNHDQKKVRARLLSIMNGDISYQ